MREDRVHQLFLGAFQRHRDDVALDQLGHLGADHVRPEQLPGLGIEHRLDQPVRLAQGDGLAVAGEGEAADLDREPQLLGLGLGEADAGDLRLAIGAAGDLALVHRVGVQALDRLDADHPLVLGLVGEHRRAGDVPDRVEAGHVGAAEPVGDDDAPLDRHAELVQADPLDVADDPHRRDQLLRRQRLGLAVRALDRGGHRIGALLDLGYLGPGEDLDALLLEALAGEPGDLGILHRQDLRQEFDHRHLRAHSAVERGELDADGARAHHEQGFGHFFGDHRLVIGPDLPLVGLDAGDGPGPGAGGHDDVLGAVGSGPLGALGRFRPLGLLDGDPAGRVAFGGGVHRGLAPDHVDLVLLQKHADAAVETGRDPARALDDGRGVEPDLLRREPVLAGMLEVMVDLGRAQQGLGGDAAPVQADAAEMLPVDHRRFEPELRRPDRGDVSAGAGADDEDVVGIGHLRLRKLSSPLWGGVGGGGGAAWDAGTG